MKRGNTILLIGFTVMLLTSCGPRHTAVNFQEQAEKHRLVALLPTEITYTGNMPKKMTEKELKKIMKRESKQFQSSLQSALFKKAKKKKGRRAIQVQSVAQTLHLLEENNIAITDISSTSDAELAEILGVDAILRSRVDQFRIMSDIASYGVSVANNVLRTVGAPVPVLPNATKHITADCALVDGKTSEVLWRTTVNCPRSSRWNRQADRVVYRLNRKFARRFPYRVI